jgi:hypothetical protein
MTDASIPTVKAPRFEEMFCERHAMPLRQDWSSALVAVAGIKLIQRCMSDDEVLHACGFDGTDGTADVFLLTQVLRNFTPLCCHLGDAKMLAVYKETRIMSESDKWCATCGRIVQGKDVVVCPVCVSPLKKVPDDETEQS